MLFCKVRCCLNTLFQTRSEMKSDNRIFFIMDKLLAQITRLSKQTTLPNGEQVLIINLASFEEVVTDQLSDELFDEFDRVLVSLLNINKGNLSVQCSSIIGKCLLHLYSQNQVPKTWTLFTTVTKKPNPALIYATGYVIDKIASKSHSSVPGFVKLLLAQSYSLIMPVTYALIQCFKRDHMELKSYVDKTMKVASKAISMPSIAIQLLGVRLFRALLRSKPNVSKISQMVLPVFSNTNSTFLIDQICYLVARMASLHIKIEQNEAPSNEENEWELKNKGKELNNEDLKKSFQIIHPFKEHFHQIARRFLFLLPPAFIHRNRKALFSYIKRYNVDDVSILINLLSSNDREELFQSVRKDLVVSESNLVLMSHLTMNEETLNETAGLALQLATRSNDNQREAGANFFSILPSLDMELSQTFLTTATTFLLRPPEKYKKINRALRGMALVASNLIYSAPSLLDAVKSDMLEFIHTSLSTYKQIWQGPVQAAFTILAVIPSELVEKDLVEKVLNDFAAYYEKNSIISDKLKMRSNSLAAAIAMFLATEPQFEAAERAIIIIYENDALTSIAADVCVSHAFPLIKYNQTIWRKLRTKINQATPSLSFIRSKLRSPMTQKTSLTRSLHAKYVHELKPIFAQVTESIFAQEVVDNFAKIILALPEEMQHHYIDTMVDHQLYYKVAPSLILTLIQNPTTRQLLPGTLPASIITEIKKVVPDRTDEHTQALCECLAIWTKFNSGYTEEIKEAIIKMPESTSKCLAYSGLLSHVNLTDTQITEVIQDLNLLSMKPEYSAYALYALGVMYQSYSIQLNQMSYGDTQCSALIEVMNTTCSLNPYNLYYASASFTAMLPVITPEMNANRLNTLKILFSLFDVTPIAFSRQIVFYTLRSLFAFARQLIKPSMLVYPQAKGTSLSCLLAACGAFADLLNFTDYDIDYFDLIPRVLFLVQIVTTDSRPSLFIQSMAKSFIAKKPLSIERLKEWTHLIKQCVSVGVLPTTEQAIVGSQEAVILCCMQVASIILPAVAETVPLITECLDDIMTSSIRAIEFSDQEIRNVSFNVISEVIEFFKDRTNENGIPILNLYDSLFNTAVRIGFMHLNESRKFLKQFLNLQIKNGNLLDSFINGVKQCKDTNKMEYISISAELVNNSRINPYVFDRLEAILPQLMKQFNDIILTAQKIWTDPETKWNVISDFRVKYSNCYNIIVSDLIWLQSKSFSSDHIPIIKLYDFFISEITSSSESWRIFAAFEGFNAILNNFAEEISDDSIMASLKTVYSSNKAFQASYLNTFIDAIACRIARNEEAWKMMIEMIESYSIYSENVFAHLIHYGTQENVLNHFEHFFNYVTLKKGPDCKRLAVSTMLFEKCPSLVEKMLNIILTGQFMRRFKVCFTFRSLKYIKTTENKDLIISLALDEPDFSLLSFIVTNHPEFGLLSSQGMIDKYQAEYDKSEIVMHLLRFAVVSVKEAKENIDKYVGAVTVFSFRYIRKFISSEHSQSITKLTAQFWNWAHKEYKPLLKFNFGKCNETDKDAINQQIERSYSRMTPRKMNTLKRFSNNMTHSASKDSFEWQSLDDSEE